MKVIIVFGTRPEAIKMAPVIKAIEKEAGIEQVIVTTGQHGTMLDQVMQIFGIHPDKKLDVMSNGCKTLNETMSYLITGLDKIIDEEKPDYMIVQGDTSTATAGAIAAYYTGVKVVHVEAGLRTWNKYDPYPEEANRQIIDVLTDVYLPPTSSAANNLMESHVSEDEITITGNTSIDALMLTDKLGADPAVLKSIPANQKIILFTMHRRETQGSKMRNVFKAVESCVASHPEVDLVYPVHANPAVREPAYEILGNHDRIHLTDPMNLIDMHEMMRRSYFIMTDSGGIQEEAPAIDRPVLVLRDETERMEAVETGALRLVGTDPVKIINAFDELLEDKVLYSSMANAINPYGDGRAANRIIKAMVKDYQRIK